MMNKKIMAMSLFLAIGAFMLVIQPTHAATYLGGVSVQAACDNQYGPGSTATVLQWNVMGWRCVFHGGWNAYTPGVDLTKQCKREYKRYTGVYANYTNFNNPYSWGCYR